MGDRVAVMSDGVLQQVDAPQELYDRPANLFVAGFIGTPPMNLLEATVTVNGGVTDLPRRRTLASPTRRCRRTRSCAAPTGGRSSRACAASTSTRRRGAPELPSDDRRVELVEALGSESMVYLHVDARGSGGAARGGARCSRASAEGVVAVAPEPRRVLPAPPS